MSRRQHYLTASYRRALFGLQSRKDVFERICMPSYCADECRLGCWEIPMSKQTTPA